MYYGGQSLTFGRNITQTGIGPFFGRSIAGGGDLNGDGFGDLVITNTGTQSDSFGYSSIEISIQAAPVSMERPIIQFNLMLKEDCLVDKQKSLAT